MTNFHVSATTFWLALLRKLTPTKTDWLVLIAYPFAYALFYWAAKPWGGLGFFSLWFPAAGLRFAILWHRGARLAPWLAVMEVAFNVAMDVSWLTSPDALHSVVDTCRPALTYGLAITAIRRVARAPGKIQTYEPLTFGFAAIVAPVFNALMVEPVEMMVPSHAVPYREGVELAVSLSGLAVGDLLGILVIAPLLLWLAALRRHPRKELSFGMPIRVLLEDVLVIAICLALNMALWRAGTGAQPIPGLLAGAWVGLRHGRMAAWFAIVAQILICLPYSAQDLSGPARLQLHLGIASGVLVTWLAGSFRDAQEASRLLLERRNRLLFQAERLKTLRAMSVAIIHEISQPLTTLAIEARHLKAHSADLEPDIAECATLIDRKAHALSDLVRRLRRFGGREVDEPSLIPVAMLVQTASQILTPDLRQQGGLIEIQPISSELVVEAQEIELTQALVNLLRNAVTASAKATEPSSVRLIVKAEADEVHIEIANRTVLQALPSAGMGVGLMIARTIVEAHGGCLTRRDTPEFVCFVMSLPLARMSA